MLTGLLIPFIAEKKLLPALLDEHLNKVII
jgi:hypothetical protein